MSAAAYPGVLGLCVTGTSIMHLSAMVTPYIPAPKPPPEPPPPQRSLVILETLTETRHDEAREAPEVTEREAIPPPPAREPPAPPAPSDTALDEALKLPSERLADSRLTTLPSFEKLIVLPEDDSAEVATNVLRAKAFRDRPTLSILGSSDAAGALAALTDTALVDVLTTGSATALSDTLEAGVAGGIGGGGAGIGTLLSSRGGAGLGTGGFGTGGGLATIATGGPSDLSTLRRAYISRIGRAVRRVREYPVVAEDDGIEGTVTVKITVGAAGEIRDVTVVRSSGHEVLDEAALRSIRQLGSLPAPPAELGWQDQPVQVSIVYALDR